jgi:carboxyl-terminal processing protease
MPKIRLQRVRFLLFSLLLLIVSFSGGYLFGVEGYRVRTQNLPRVTLTREVPPDKNLDFALFWQVWDTLESEYFDKSQLNSSQMIYGAIKGMVEAVGDPYTAFLPPEENKVIQEDLSGNFEGVGIQIGFRGTQLAVIAPLPGTPAEKAGIKAGDYIIGIVDKEKEIDKSTAGISLAEAVQAIRGPAGSKVTLILLRNGSDQPIEAEVTRAAIDVPSVVLEFQENDQIAYLQLLKFTGETKAEWDAAVTEVLENAKVKGIIVDVRNNPGGFLDTAVDIANEFLERNEVIVIEEGANGQKEEFAGIRVGRLREIPLVVLVNKGSASASEIFAGAIADHDRGQIIGETTFGKGTIQEPKQLTKTTGLHLTIARWLTPDGTWVNDKGLEPDIKVEDNPETEIDEQLQEAIKSLI